MMGPKGATESQWPEAQVVGRRLPAGRPLPATITHLGLPARLPDPFLEITSVADPLGLGLCAKPPAYFEPFRVPDYMKATVSVNDQMPTNASEVVREHGPAVLPVPAAYPPAEGHKADVIHLSVELTKGPQYNVICWK